MNTSLLWPQPSKNSQPTITDTTASWERNAKKSYRLLLILLNCRRISDHTAMPLSLSPPPTGGVVSRWSYYFTDIHHIGVEFYKQRNGIPANRSSVVKPHESASLVMELLIQRCRLNNSAVALRTLCLCAQSSSSLTS